MQLTRDAILALAPDAASAKAAQGLVNPSTWPSLGANDAAVWGECKGSGAKPYQTQIDLSGPSFRCSCPSRKFPCKHGLALLLLKVDREKNFSSSGPPAWVTEWLDSRSERERKREDRQKDKPPATPVDEKAAAERDAKRQAQRWDRVADGGTELQRWLGDLMRRGLGAVTREKLDDWHTMAARLVDAQAPGLGQRLKQAAAIVGTSADWPERVLHRVGLLYLATQAIARRGELPEATVADLRTVVGWPIDKADVLALGQSVEDCWLVLGMAIEERDDKLTERRVWLHGGKSGRRALILDHAFAGRGFEQAWVVGATVAATLGFYPGAWPLRALSVTAPAAAAESVSIASRTGDEWQRVAESFAACPWTPLLPVLLPDAILTLRDGGVEAVVGDKALSVAVTASDQYPLLAVGGAHPVTVMGEWDGEFLRPLTVWRSGEAAPAWQRSLA